MKKPFTELAKACCALVFLILISTLDVSAQYCASNSTNTIDEWLSNVNFAGIDNTSGSTTYSDFTDINGLVIPGVSYEFSGTISQTGTFSETLVVYIDWDQSETFEASERTQIGTSCASNGCVLTADIAVPVDATPGETRMRVVQKWLTASTNPCEVFTFGEVEDYSLTVNSGECTPPSLTFDVINDCAADTYSVSSVIDDYGTNNFVTIIVTRSDEVPANDVNLLAIAVPPGSTVPIINNVPFGVSVSLSIEGQNPICNLSRNFTEEICPAENDEACTATPLVCGDNFSDLVFEGATQSIDDACFGSGTADVWFSFTADGTQSYTVAETQTDVVVDLWEGDDCGNLTQVTACADFPESVTVYEAGTYYFRIRPWSTATTYGVSLTCAPFDCEELGGDIGNACDDGDAGTVNDEITDNCECIGEPVAANDEACTATLLECGDALTGQSFAGSSPSVEDACSGTGTGDVWFTFVADGTQTYFIAETETDVVVDLWSGDDCGNLTSLSDCVDFGENFTVTEAGTYYFRIRPWSTFTTTYGVSLTCTPFDCPGLGNFGDACDDGDAGTVNDLITEDCVCAGVTPASNDEPCTAIALACNDTLVDQTFLGATVTIEDGCTNPTNGDVWYSFTAMEGMAYQINEPSFNSTTASLYIAEEGDCETLTEVVGCTTFFNSFTITEPGDYFFRIRAYSTQISHSVGFICTEIPVNDECTEALPLTCGETYTGSTLGSTAYPDGQPFCITSAPTAGNGGVWYTITPDNDTEIDLDLSGSGYDTKLFLYTGTCDGLVCVDGDDDGGDGVDSQLDATLTAGTTYYVFVTGFSSNRGEYLLNVSCVDLVCSPTIESAAAVDAEGQPLECVDFFGTYYLEVTLAGGTQATYNVSAGDSPVTVIDADGTGIVGPIAGGNTTVNVVGTDNPNCGATLDYVATACPPANDEACGAVVLECGDSYSGLSFAGATQSVDDACSGSGAADVWFTFVADGTQTYFIEETETDVVVDLWSGDDCGNLTAESGCVDFGENFTITEAGTYYFRIRPWSVNTTTYGVSLTCTPFDCPGLGNIGGSCDDGDPNTVNDEVSDNCECIGEPVIANDEACTATLLECGDVLTDQSFAGSSQSVDDACSGTGTGDVWYTFVADGTQSYFIEETETDVVVDLWVGDDCGNLTSLSTCVDFGENFTVNEAGTYYFRIRPWSVNTTTYGVSLTCTPFDCPGVGNIGDACDDGDETTGNDVITENCECVGTPLPPNDLCVDAIALECGTPLEGTTIGGTQSGIASPACAGGSLVDVFYSLDIVTGVEYTLTVNGDDFDGVLVLYSGECDALVEEACADNGFTAGVAETIIFTANVDGTILIRTYDWSTTNGSFTIGVTCVADDIAAFNGSVNWNSNCDDRMSTVTFYEPNTATVAATYETMVNSAGDFSIPDVLVGTYDIIVDVPGYLNKGLADVETVVGDNNVDFGNITGGDANDNNNINVADFSGLNSAFGSVTGDANYILFADFNCSGSINVADFSGLNAAFGQSGAIAPLP